MLGHTAGGMQRQDTWVAGGNTYSVFKISPLCLLQRASEGSQMDALHSSRHKPLAATSLALLLLRFFLLGLVGFGPDVCRPHQLLLFAID